MLNPPSEYTATDFPELRRHQFTIEGPTDVVVSGLGWVTVQDAGVKIAMWAPAGVDVYLRKPMI